MTHVNINSDGFYAENVGISVKTIVSEVGLANGGFNRTIKGSQPNIITLEGRVLPSDKSTFEQIIKKYVGKANLTVVLGSSVNSSMMMSEGEVVFRSGELLGKMKMVFKRL